MKNIQTFAAFNESGNAHKKRLSDVKIGDKIITNKKTMAYDEDGEEISIKAGTEIIVTEVDDKHVANISGKVDGVVYSFDPIDLGYWSPNFS